MAFGDTIKKVTAINKQTGSEYLNKQVNAVLQTEKNPRVIWRQLTLSIYQSPSNLKLHTQRILYCLDNDLHKGLSEYASGALYDLFVTLNEKGSELRHRMFNLASPIMSFADRAYFQVWLSENTDKNLACYQFSGSVLKSKTCQNQNGDTKNSFRVSPPFENTLEEAKYKIESGQLEQAQTLLEDFCLKKINNIASQQELQRFYFYTKDKKSMDAFMLQLKDSGVKVPKTWIELQALSKAW